MRIWWNGTMLYVCICGIPFVWRLLKPENILTISCSVVGYWWACSRSVPQEFSIIVFWTEKLQPTKDGSQFWKPNFARKKTSHSRHVPQQKKPAARIISTKVHPPNWPNPSGSLHWWIAKDLRPTSAQICQPRVYSSKNQCFGTGISMLSYFKNLKWISVYSGLGCVIHPCQKTTCRSQISETSPRFNFNKFQSTQTGSFDLTIFRFQFHVCRPHLHSCLGSWHLSARKW